LLISVREFDKKGKLTYKQSEGDLKNIIHHYREVSDENSLIPVNLEVNYEISDDESIVSLRIGEDKLYVVKSLGKFLSNLIDNKATEFSKNFYFSPSRHCFSEKDKEFIEFLKLLYENYEVNYSQYYNH